jgi:hypothetical protein
MFSTAMKGTISRSAVQIGTSDSSADVPMAPAESRNVLALAGEPCERRKHLFPSTIDDYNFRCKCELKRDLIGKAVARQRSNQLNYVPSLFSSDLWETLDFAVFPSCQ